MEPTGGHPSGPSTPGPEEKSSDLDRLKYIVVESSVAKEAQNSEEAWRRWELVRTVNRTAFSQLCQSKAYAVALIAMDRIKGVQEGTKITKDNYLDILQFAAALLLPPKVSKIDADESAPVYNEDFHRFAGWVAERLVEQGHFEEVAGVSDVTASLIGPEGGRNLINGASEETYEKAKREGREKALWAAIMLYAIPKQLREL